MKTIEQDWQEINAGLAPEEMQPEILTLLRHTFYLGINAMMLNAQQAAKLSGAGQTKEAADGMNAISKELKEYFDAVDIDNNKELTRQ